MKKIAVIMTVHNRCAQTIACLQKLSEEKQQCDIYLTDDGCTDGTAAAVRNSFPQVTIVEGDGKLFWNRGMRKAWEVAARRDYDFYLWLNDDTIIRKGFIDVLLKCSRSEEDKSIICGAVVSSKDNLKISYGGFTSKIKLLPISDNKQSCIFASGNILLIPSYVYNKVGNLDYYYHHALGDFDYEGRARKKGIKIIQAPGYLGYCEKHANIPVWRDINNNIFKRIKFLYSPLGRNPMEFLRFDYRHHGIGMAIVHFFTIHLRCIFPKLWYKKYDEKE